MVRAAACAILVLLSCMLATAGASAGTVEAYRMLQADADGAAIGSPQYAARGYLTLPAPNAKTLRGVMAVSAAEKKPTALAEYVAKRSGLEALLVIIPQQLDDESRQNLRDIEETLLGVTMSVPVFFARETPELQAAVTGTAALLASGTPPSATTDRWEVALQGVPAAEERGPQPYNYWAMLSGSQPAGETGRTPTVLVTAHYDTFCAAPSGPCGADSNGSGVAALLALMRALHLLYKNPETQPVYNTLFLLTSGGAVGHEGIRQWLGDAEPEVLRSIVFGLALDSIGGSNSSSGGAAAPLYLHLGAGQPDGAFLEAFKAASSRAGVPLQQVPGVEPAPSRSGAAVAAVAAAWAHQHLAKKGIPSATLSSRAEQPQLGIRSSSSSEEEKRETPQQVALSSIRVSSLADAASDVGQVLRATQLAADALQQLLYPDLPQGLKLLDIRGAKAVYAPLVSAWMSLLANTPRTHPLDHTTAVGKALHQSLMRYLREHSNIFKRHLWQASSSTPAGSTLTRLAVQDAGSATLKVYFAAGAFMDMVLAAGTVVYLAALWVVVRLVTSGWDEVVRPFQSETPSRGKGSKAR